MSFWPMSEREVEAHKALFRALNKPGAPQHAQPVPTEHDPQNPLTADPILWNLVCTNEFVTDSFPPHSVGPRKFTRKGARWFWEERWRRMYEGLAKGDRHYTP